MVHVHVLPVSAGLHISRENSHVVFSAPGWLLSGGCARRSLELFKNSDLDKPEHVSLQSLETRDSLQDRVDHSLQRQISYI